MKIAIRTCRIVARVTPEELAQIKALASSLGTTKTHAIVHAVKLALAKTPKGANDHGKEKGAD